MPLPAGGDEGKADAGSSSALAGGNGTSVQRPVSAGTIGVAVQSDHDHSCRWRPNSADAAAGNAKQGCGDFGDVIVIVRLPKAEGGRESSHHTAEDAV